MSTSEPAGPGRRGDLRGGLIDVALGMLAEGGADSISLRGVAQRAGVSAMAPYRHYPDKEALLAAVAARGFDRLGEAVRAVGPDSEHTLAELVAAYVGFARANPALFRLMYGPPRQGDHPGLVAARAAAYVLVRERLPEEPAGELAPGLGPRSLGCWAVMHGLAMLLLDGQLDGKGLGPDGEVARAVARALFPAGRGAG